MKQLQQDDLFGYSVFDESRNIDFHSVLWRRPSGNVLVDPLPVSAHDAEHLRALGGAALIVVTNSDHVRATREIRALTHARVAGPRAERVSFPIDCDLWLGDGDEPVPGLSVLELHGGKTPGELALLLDQSVLVVGDLVRAHRAGELTILPDAKLSDLGRAKGSVARLASLPNVDAVLTGDGWPVFRDGHRALVELSARLSRR
jgi:hypothetical protein